MTHEAMGVGKVNDMAVFVQGAVEGERVIAKIIKTAKNYAVARVEEWLSVSPDVGSRSARCTRDAAAAACSI